MRRFGKERWGDDHGADWSRLFPRLSTVQCRRSGMNARAPVACAIYTTLTCTVRRLRWTHGRSPTDVARFWRCRGSIRQRTSSVVAWWNVIILCSWFIRSSCSSFSISLSGNSVRHVLVEWYAHAHCPA